MRRPCSVSTRVASSLSRADLRIERHEQPHVVPGGGQLARQGAGHVGEAAALGERDDFGCDGADREFHGGGHSSALSAAGSIAPGLQIPMRRVLTFLTAIVLLLVSLGVGVFTADLPFWRRALQLPLPAGRRLPTRGRHRRTPAAAAEAAAVRRSRVSTRSVVEESVSRARDAGSRALLVMYRGALAVERYFVDRRRAHACCRPALVARPARGHGRGHRARRRQHRLARRTGRALPARVGRRGARPHHRCGSCSRKPAGWKPAATSAACCIARRGANLARLPAFATSQGRAHVVRQRLRIERARLPAASTSRAASTTCRRPTRSSPRSSSSAPPATPYENFVDRALWRAVGAGRAELQLDRRAGMPAAHCCWRATARDMLRILSLLGTDGVHDGRAVLPAGWVREMARASRVSAGTGMQVDAAQHRRRRSARGHGRRRQRVLGHSAAAARHPQHREPGRQRCRTCRAVAEGNRGAGAAPMKSASDRVDSRGARRAECAPWI